MDAAPHLHECSDIWTTCRGQQKIKNTGSGSWMISGTVSLRSSTDRKGFKKRKLPPAFMQVAASFCASIVFVFCSYLASAPPNSGYVLPGHAFDLIGLSPPRGPHGGALSDTSIVSASACHRLRFGCAETSKSWMRLAVNQSYRLCGLPVTRQQRECKEYAELFGFQGTHNRGGYVAILIFWMED